MAEESEGGTSSNKVVAVLESEEYPHPCVHLAEMDPDDKQSARLIEPTKEEVAEGRATLEDCLPHWRATPALLIVKPTLAIAVKVRSHTEEALGFRLHLEATDLLMAPEEMDLAEFDVFCGWNQPYVSIDRNELHAPYSFTLHFGVEGVAHARELTELILSVADQQNEREWEPTIYRGCFGADGAEYLEVMRSSLRGNDQPSLRPEDSGGGPGSTEPSD